MARDPQADAERMIAALDRAVQTMDKASRNDYRLLGEHHEQQMIAHAKMDKVVHTLGVLDTVHTAAEVTKGVNPISGSAVLASRAAGALAGKDSNLGDLAKVGEGVGSAGAAMSGHPLAIANAALSGPEAISTALQMSYKVPQRFMKNAAQEGSSTISEAAGAMREERGARQAGRAMGAAGHAAGMLPGLGTGLAAKAAVTGSIAGVATFLAGPLVMKVTERLQDFSEKLHNSNMQFAEYSGGMAAVMAMQQVRDIELSQERGERRALSAGYLAEGKHQLNKDMGAVEDVFATIKNLGAGFFDRLISPITGAIREAAEGIQERINQWAKDMGIEGGDEMKGINADFKGWADIDKEWKQDRPERFR